MKTVVIAGAAATDFVFDVAEMPRRPEKYRAANARILGGGGAANAAVALRRLGGRAMLAARIGADVVGDMILAELAGEAVDTSLVRRLPTIRSSFSSIFVDASGERQIVNFRDDRTETGAAWLESPLPAITGACLADTRWPAAAAALMRQARRLGVPGVLDAEAPVAPANDALDAASHVAFSAQGLRDFAGIDTLDKALADAGRRILGWVCYTDGAGGSTFLRDGALVNVASFPVDVVDTLGAGDVWHAAFTLALAEGRGEPHAMRFANAAAGLKCSRRNGRADYPLRAEVEAMLEHDAEKLQTFRKTSCDKTKG